MPTSLRHLANWINSHDDGTQYPRATVQGDSIVVRSTLHRADGETEVETVNVRTVGEARAVLGY